MSRSNTPARSTTPSRTYGEILGSIFSAGLGNSEGSRQQQHGDNLRSASVEKALSELHSTRSNNNTNNSKSQETRSSVSDEAKRIFRERRREQQKSPGRSSASATTNGLSSRGGTPERRNPTPERRQHQASPGRFASPTPPSSTTSVPVPTNGCTKSRTATPERKHQFRLLPFASSAGKSHQGRSRTPTLLERSSTEKKHAKQLSSSPTKQRDDSSREVPTSHIPPIHHKQPLHNQNPQPHHQPPRQSQEQRIPPASELNDVCTDESKIIFSLQKELKELKHRYENEMQNIEKTNEKEKQAMANISETLAHLQETVHVQNEQVNFYETRLRDRDMEIKSLELELEQCRKRQASLELELEVHDSKFSIYDDYRRLMDKERLDKDNIDDDDIDDDKYETSGTGLEQSEWNSQKHNILSKLHRLEELFEQSITDVTLRYATLYEEHKSALAKIFFLEQRQPAETRHKGGVMGDECSEMSAESVSLTVPTVPATDLGPVKDVIGDYVAYSTNEEKPVTTVGLLTKRIQIFEADNLRLSLQVQVLQEELHRTRAIQNDVTLFKDENEVSALRLEKDALLNKIAALETEIGFTSGQIDDKTRTRRYRMLEKNLNGYIAEIMSLEDKMRAKESVVARLKERDLTRRLGLESNSVISEPVTESTHKWYESNFSDGIAATRTTTIIGNPKAKTTSDAVVELNEVMSNSDLPRAEVMRNRLNQRIKELKRKTKKQNNVVRFASTTMAGSSHKNTDGTNMSTSSRVAMLRKRLDEMVPHANDNQAGINTSDSNDLISI